MNNNKRCLVKINDLLVGNNKCTTEILVEVRN